MGSEMCIRDRCNIIHFSVIIILSTVRSRKIVNVMSPREGVLVLGHGHIGLIVKMQILLLFNLPLHTWR